MQAVVTFKDGTVERFDEPLAVVIPRLIQQGRQIKSGMLSEPIKTYTELQIKRMEAAEKKRKPRTKKAIWCHFLTENVS